MAAMDEAAGNGSGWVLQPDESREYDFREGCRILELLNDQRDPAVSVARARVPAGGTTRWHRLTGTVERDVLLAGSGVVEVGGLAPTRVGPGTVVVIPAGAAQRIHNPGPGELVFLAVCTPRFAAGAYVDLEDKSPVGAAP